MFKPKAKDIHEVTTAINAALGLPEVQYNRDGSSNVGHIKARKVAHGWTIEQVVNSGGGVISLGAYCIVPTLEMYRTLVGMRDIAQLATVNGKPFHWHVTRQ